ncbi:MAG TPA: hypothetical protein V6D11_04160 [Waterburya sp.]
MSLTQANSGRCWEEPRVGGFPPTPPIGGRSASPKPPAQGLIDGMSFFRSVLYDRRP